jgi:hypothetical protein
MTNRFNPCPTAVLEVCHRANYGSHAIRLRNQSGIAYEQYPAIAHSQ